MEAGLDTEVDMEVVEVKEEEAVEAMVQVMAADLDMGRATALDTVVEEVMNPHEHEYEGLRFIRKQLAMHSSIPLFTFGICNSQIKL